MATPETQQLDAIIASRRALLVGGGAALAALAMTKPAAAASTVSTYTDNDILNFALNLEYLEANFYYLAAFGTTIDKANPLYPSGAMVQGITGVGTAGGAVITKPAFLKVPFTSLAIASYAVETAIEEGKHVAFLRGALGSLAVAQPQLDLFNSFNALASLAGVPGGLFDPFASDANFLIGAYIFEDVGVTAYKGAAFLLTNKTTILPAAAGILAVEAYHAGLVRTSINAMDVANGNTNLSALTKAISGVRTGAAQAVATTKVVDDFGVVPQTVNLNGQNVAATTLVNADSNVVAFSRTTTQVLNIVTAGGAVAAGVSKGAFFPNGLNGLFT